MSWVTTFVEPANLHSAETLPKRKKAFGRILTSDSIVPGTIAHDSKIPRDRLRFVNTDVVLYGEKMAQYRAAQAAFDKEFMDRRKIHNQLHDRQLRRQFHREQAEYRRGLQLQSGQREISMQFSGSRSSLFGRNQSSGSHKKPVPPGDILMSIERFSRLPGRGDDDAGGLVPNGSMSYDGGEKSLEPTFTVDPTQREVRRVVTGGPGDRLHYSDGSHKVVLDPKVIQADPKLASKPLLLRNGTAYIIGTQNLQKLSGETGKSYYEVPQLTEYHHKRESHGFGTRGDDLSFTTSKSPRSWEKSVRFREKYVEKQKDKISRPDKDAVAEYYALRKVNKEQEERKALYERIAEHRESELKKMQERQARRLVLQVKAGQVHPQALVSVAGSDFVTGSKEEVNQGLSSSIEDVLSGPWTGSWTSHSQYAGSLTHNATKGQVSMLHDPHRFRMDH